MKPDSNDGDAGRELTSGGRLFEECYEELRRLAVHRLRGQSAEATLNPTALVHEVYLRLSPGRRVAWATRAHFMGAAAQMMRRVIIDFARRTRAARRGEGWKRVVLDQGTAARTLEATPEALWVAEMVDQLAELDARQGRILELRIFAGATVEEVAEALNMSKRAVEAEWTMIRAWLRQQYAQKRGGGGHGELAGGQGTLS